MLLNAPSMNPANRKNSSPVWGKYQVIQNSSDPSSLRFQCPLCGKVFKRTSGAGFLEKHLKKHEEESSSTQREAKVEDLSLKVLNFIVGKRLPLNTVEDESFQALMPTARHLNSKSLKSLMKSEVVALREYIFRKYDSLIYASIVIDGWEGPRGHVYSVGFRMSGNYYFYNQYHTSESQNSAWILSFFQPLIDEMRENNIIVTSVTSDNASVLSCAFRNVSSVVHHRCSSHCLNILINKYLTHFDIKKKCQEYTEILRNTKAKIKIIPYVQTRWYSMFAHIRSIKREFQKNCPERLEDIQQMKNILKHLKIMNQTLGDLESDSCSIFDVFPLLLDMVDELVRIRTEHSQYILNEFSRMHNKLFDKSNLIKVAAFLNPSALDRVKKRYTNIDGIIALVIELGEKWGIALDIETLERYSRKEPGFIFGAASPEKQWYNLTKLRKDDNINKIYQLVEILDCVAPSETYIERAFSREGPIHTPLRNRMSIETVNNIMFLSMNINLWRCFRNLY